MQKNSNDYKFCIKLALDNAKIRINLLDNSDKRLSLASIKCLHSLLPASYDMRF